MKAGTVVRIYDPSTEVGGSLVWGQLGLQSKFKASPDSKKKKKQNNYKSIMNEKLVKVSGF
jgi:hypothetical protein